MLHDLTDSFRVLSLKLPRIDLRFFLCFLLSFVVSDLSLWQFPYGYMFIHHSPLQVSQETFIQYSIEILYQMSKRLNTYFLVTACIMVYVTSSISSTSQLCVTRLQRATSEVWYCHYILKNMSVTILYRSVTTCLLCFNQTKLGENFQD